MSLHEQTFESASWVFACLFVCAYVGVCVCVLSVHCIDNKFVFHTTQIADCPCRVCLCELWSALCKLVMYRRVFHRSYWVVYLIKRQIHRNNQIKYWQFDSTCVCTCHHWTFPMKNGNTQNYSNNKYKAKFVHTSDIQLTSFSEYSHYRSEPKHMDT